MYRAAPYITLYPSGIGELEMGLGVLLGVIQQGPLSDVSFVCSTKKNLKCKTLPSPEWVVALQRQRRPVGARQATGWGGGGDAS